MIALLAVVGCTDAVDSPTTSSVLRIEPHDATLLVTDGKPVTQRYQAILTLPDGTEQDVTAQTSISLMRPELGLLKFQDLETTLEARGAAVGTSTIFANYGDLQAVDGVTVYANTTIVDVNAWQAKAQSLFAAATLDDTCFPQIAYPEAESILPSNLDGLDVAWTDERDNLFQMTFETTYTKLQVFTTSLHRGISADAWAQLASTQDPISMRVAGLDAGNPATACTTQTRTLRVTDKPMWGAIYSWSDGGGIWRHDVATRGEPEPLFITTVPSTITTTSFTGSLASSCDGCAVSHNGSRIAVRLDDGDGAIVDFTQNRLMTPMTWEEATFTPLANKLVITSAGTLSLIDETGNLLRTINTMDTASNPQLSPDGTKLVDVEAGELMIRSYQDDGDKFGFPSVLVAAPGTVNHAPAWSPDGNWIAYTRTTGWGTTEAMSSIWVIKADGSQSATQVTGAINDADQAAAWAPVEQRVAGEPFFYLSFDAKTQANRQIYLMPFFPASRLTRPAFRAPYQSASLSNHVSQWSTRIVY